MAVNSRPLYRLSYAGAVIAWSVAHRRRLAIDGAESAPRDRIARPRVDVSGERGDAGGGGAAGYFSIGTSGRFPHSSHDSA